MIRVELALDNKGKIIDFFISGHADYAEYGEDIICAAVSAVAQTAVIGIQKYLENENLVIQQSEGLLALKLPENLAKGNREKADIILNTMHWGLKNIEEQHKEHLIIIEKSEGGVGND